MNNTSVPTIELVGPAGRVVVNTGAMEAEYRRNGYTDPGAAPAKAEASPKPSKKTAKKSSHRLARSDDEAGE